ncbi:precorrin-2 dehydrogenase/sirohydrochlorin ferrochelatase family protein [Alkalithermobacter paradoxus]
MINLENKEVAIVGGGKIAFRKAKKLLEYGANLKIISPSIIPEIYNIGDEIEIIKDRYNEEHIRNSFMVIAATSSKCINEDVVSYCKKNRILCSAVDNINNSDFISVSSIKKGDLVISASTSGKSPSLSSKIIKELEYKYTEEYIEYIKLLGDIRQIVLQKCSDEHKKKKILNEIVSLSIEELKMRRYEYENSSWI